jgi:hypothetical protein
MLINMTNLNHLVILILSTNDAEYDKFKSALRSTWIKDIERLGIKFFFYEGGAEENIIINDTIKLKVSDKLHSVSEKFVIALRVVLEKFPETRVIYRTNLSSYIDVDNFLKYMESRKIDEESYAGLIGKARMFRERLFKYPILYYFFNFIPLGKKLRFANGSGFFLGVTHCRKIISSEVNLNLVDDIMVADAVKSGPSDLLEPKRLRACRKTHLKLSKSAYSQLLEKDLLFHYRFKTFNRKLDARLLSQFGDKSFRRAYFTGQGDK